VIVDLEKFILEERPHWQSLEAVLDALERDPESRMSLDEAKRFHYLYQRASADLARIMTFSGEPETSRYLESLVSRAYAEIHETRDRPHRFSPLRWFFTTLPVTLRRHIGAFGVSLAAMLVGFVFGAMAVSLDPGAKEVLVPFPHLKGSPSERVSQEESVQEDRLEGIKMQGAAMYMTHNTRISIATMALGVTWGLGTLIVLFSNGVVLGAVSMDYILAGQARFLVAWLSPHGVIEIPAIVLAGQAGLVLAGALIGWGRRATLRTRLREISGDLVTLICGVAVMLVWAGIIESFVSQYHEPVLPYSFKTGFAVVELILLVAFLTVSGEKGTSHDKK
jgi:uncharacterized membrane protein SpoIIM required for sporulation